MTYRSIICYNRAVLVQQAAQACVHLGKVGLSDRLLVDHTSDLPNHLDVGKNRFEDLVAQGIELFDSELVQHTLDVSQASLVRVVGLVYTETKCQCQCQIPINKRVMQQQHWRDGNSTQTSPD